jgi:hypothetical protein
MKRMFLITVLTLATTATLFASAVAAVFGWATTAHDFGRIPQGKPAVAEFRFTNKGELPLIVSRAQGSCGCTGVDYPKTPVLPGQSGVIRATFNAASVGAFNKSVSVESNAEGGTMTLYVKGEVVKTGEKL